MRFGCCASIDQASIIHDAGYDYIECTVVSLLPEKDDATFKDVLKRYNECPLPVEACNVFLPSNMKIVGDEVDNYRVKNYLENALNRVKQIGATTVVFGSGGARNIPNGFNKEKAEEQILQFLHLAADFADPLGITIVIEPLNKKESNVINTVCEAMDIAEKVNRTAIQVLADFYHMDEETESLEHIVFAKEWIKHIHVADSGRFSPGTGQYPYSEFAHRISQANYNGRISIECNWGNFEEELIKAKHFLNSVFKQDHRK